MWPLKGTMALILLAGETLHLCLDKHTNDGGFHYVVEIKKGEKQKLNPPMI